MTLAPSYPPSSTHDSLQRTSMAQIVSKGANISLCSKFIRSKRRCCGIRPGITEEGVRDAVVDIAGIETDDLLYFSHSNVALSHLPYMVALDRCPPLLSPLNIRLRIYIRATWSDKQIDIHLQESCLGSRIQKYFSYQEERYQHEEQNIEG